MTNAEVLRHNNRIEANLRPCYIKLRDAEKDLRKAREALQQHLERRTTTMADTEAPPKPEPEPPPPPNGDN